MISGEDDNNHNRYKFGLQLPIQYQSQLIRSTNDNQCQLIPRILDNMKFFAVIACVLAVAQAEYAPSGWKPQGARLALPTEYGPPGQVAQNQNLEIEITKENIEFAGQLGETTTEPNNEYLPPTTTLETPEDAPVEVNTTLNHFPFILILI